jgi:hypothetical protein
MMKTWTGLIEAMYGISRRLERFYRRLNVCYWRSGLEAHEYRLRGTSTYHYVRTSQDFNDTFAF